MLLIFKFLFSDVQILQDGPTGNAVLLSSVQNFFHSSWGFCPQKSRRLTYVHCQIRAAHSLYWEAKDVLAHDFLLLPSQLKLIFSVEGRLLSLFELAFEVQEKNRLIFVFER